MIYKIFLVYENIRYPLGAVSRKVRQPFDVSLLMYIKTHKRDIT